MTVWKTCFFFALLVWVFTLAVVVWHHHGALNGPVQWTNEHLFARASSSERQLHSSRTGAQIFADTVRHRPFLDPLLLGDDNQAAAAAAARPAGSRAVGNLPPVTTTFARGDVAERQPARAGAGGVGAGGVGTDDAKRRSSPFGFEAKAVQRKSSVSRVVARSGCHHILGGCSECLRHFDGRPDFAGEDCVPVVPASIVDNTCEPRRWVTEQNLPEIEDCDTSNPKRDGSSQPHVSAPIVGAGEIANSHVNEQVIHSEKAAQTYLAELTGAPFPLQHDVGVSGRGLSNKARTMCRSTYEHTLKTTTKILADGGTFVFTGDLDDLWLRDSAAQIHPYLNYVHSDPQMRRLAEGLVKRHAFYVLFDPYANAFRIDTSYKFSDKQMSIGRHDYISTWDYELDSGCYFLRLVYALWRAAPDSAAVADEQTHRAAATMVDVWKAEQRHEEDPPMVGVHESGDKRFKKVGKPYRMPLVWPPLCRDCTALARQGKGPRTAYTGMTWTAMRPSDDPCTFNYLVPANMFASVALKYVEELASKVWHDDGLAKRALALRNDIDNGIREHAIVNHPNHGKIYAYEVDGLGGVNLMDDANVPNLLSIPYLGWDYDPEIYANTRAFVLSKDNPTYHESRNGKVKGFGSPHMEKRIKKNIWPMAQIMQGLTSSSIDEKLDMIEMLTATDGGTGWMHESYDADNPRKFTRAWFCWPDSLFAELVMSVAGTNQCPA